MKKTIIIMLSVLFVYSAFASDEYGDVDIHGFISQGFLQSDEYKFYYADTDDGTYEFNEFGINFATDLTDEVRLGMQLLAKDLGSIGNDKVVIDWAYADYAYRDWLSLLVGKIKRPMGFYNQARDIDATRTMIFLPESIYNEIYRDSYLSNKGAALYGSVPGGIDYTLLYGIMDIPVDGGVGLIPVTNMRATVDSVDIDNSFSADIKWNVPFLEGLTLTYNFTNWDFTHIMSQMPNPATGAPLAGAYQYNNKGEWNLFGLEYSLSDFVFTAEHRIMDNDNSLEIYQGPVLGWVDSPQYDADFEALYVMISYSFTDWFSAAVCYSADYADSDDKDGKEAEAAYGYAINTLLLTTDPTGQGRPFKEMTYLKDTSVSTRFDINDYWILKLEFHFMDGLKDVNFLESDDFRTNPSVVPDPKWYMGAVKLTYTF